MPPRPNRRKVDPVKQQENFEIWKKSDKYQHWMMLKQENGAFKRVSTTTRDMCDYREVFLENLYTFVSMMKAGMPRKRPAYYDQLMLRTAFFMSAGDDRNFWIKIDGTTYPHLKEMFDYARKVREEFVSVLSCLESIDQAEAENYVKLESDMKKALQSFDTSYAKHLRLSHEELYNKTLLPAIRPLLDAAEANINLYYLENRSGEKKKWFDDAAPEFRMTACKTRFCETMTNLIKVLREHAGLIGVMNVIRSLNKFQIDINESPAFKAFVTPVKNGWRKVRSELKSLWYAGRCRFKQPLKKNKAIIGALNTLIMADDLAEQLLGDELKKDQLKFMYNIVKHIFDSPFQEKLVELDETVINEMIPELACFEALVQMSEVSKEIQEKERELKEVGLELEASRADRSNSSIWSNDREDRYEGIRRKWLWEGYIRDAERDDWEETSQMVSEVNYMIQHDIADYFIAKHIQHPDQPPFEPRPPVVWNLMLLNNKWVDLEPRINEEDKITNLREHLKQFQQRKFREYVRPMECYVDGRVDAIVERVTKLAIGLKRYQDEAWNLLVKEVVQIFQKQELPEEEEDDISFDEPLQEILENDEDQD